MAFRARKKPAVSDGDLQPVVLGRVSGLFGVRGWVKIHSYTAPRGNILEYREWLLGEPGGWRSCRVEDGHTQGKGVVAKVEGYDDRDQAASLVGLEIAVARRELPEPAEGEYYWADLIGLRVVNSEGVELGRVDSLLETGANDVLVVQGERQRLIPFTGQTVLTVDLASGRVTVDWDPDF